MKLWGGGLYTSYVTMECTYIHRALEHPDYAAKLAEAVNDAAHRLANFDMSCGTKFPEREVIYGQSAARVRRERRCLYHAARQVG